MADEGSVAATDWGLSSTNGYVRLLCAPVAGCQVAFVHNVRLGDHLSETAVRAMAAVEGLALSGERLAQLVVDLRVWLGQSLGALAADPLEYSIDLARGPAESLKLTLGSRHDVITAVGGVACSVELRSNALSATVPLATDPTCLQLLVDGVKRDNLAGCG